MFDSREKEEKKRNQTYHFLFFSRHHVVDQGEKCNVFAMISKFNDRVDNRTLNRNFTIYFMI